jgi:pimeloyl-ACP methyl ester carboxylesterase
MAISQEGKTVRTATLEIAYLESGPTDGVPVILLHGFPDDPRCYDDVAPLLAAAGCRVLAPWLRGYGPTRFLDPATPRSGQQAALGVDLRDFIDALALDRPLLAGYDWGGRAACIVAALWPERVRALVSVNGYNIQHIATANRPASAAQELRYWYQWYFHMERGHAGLSQNRREICRMLWRLWSPNYRFDEQTYDITADSFDNPDFVDVVIQSYRHRYGNASGDPALERIEQRLAEQPPIGVPTIVLDGEADGVSPASPDDHHAHHFTGAYQRRIVPAAGHFLPREAPDVFASAIRELLTIG